MIDYGNEKLNEIFRDTWPNLGWAKKNNIKPINKEIEIMTPDRLYLIIPVSEISKIDFTQVYENSPETLRKSIDGNKTVIKWEDDEPIPTFTVVDEFGNTNTYPITDIVGAEGPYTHSEILKILSNAEWSALTDE